MGLRKNYFLVLSFMLLGIGSVKASADLYNFVVWTSGGEQVKYSLTENPKVSHNGTSLVVTTSATSVQYDVVDVERFTIEESSPTTKLGGAVQNETEIVRKGNVLYLSGFDVNIKVLVSDMSGKCVYMGNTDENGTMSVDLSEYETGVYVVSTNSINCKIIKK